MDFIYSSFLALIKNCSSKEIHPIEVGFNFPSPENLGRYHEIFDSAIIKFSCENPYIIYTKTDLENEITGTDPSLFEHFDVLLKDTANEHDKINEQSRAVRSSILKRLKAEIPRAEEVARELAMSVRSLQDSLKKEGTSFQNILNNVRKEIAIKQLSRPDFNVTDVAFLTGFSDVSVFSRNFKKWTGFTPTEFQNQK
jgi:AraC-like DNA-binding protein